MILGVPFFYSNSQSIMLCDVGKIFFFSNHKNDKLQSPTVYSQKFNKIYIFKKDQELFSCSIADLYLSETIEYTAPR